MHGTFRSAACLLTVVAIGVACLAGCETSRQHRLPFAPFSTEPAITAAVPTRQPIVATVQLASHSHEEEPSQPLPLPGAGEPEVVIPAPPQRIGESLEDLEAIAISTNPALRRRRLEAEAAWAKTGYVSKLPDPTLGAMVYTPPMNYDPDRQRAEVQVMQMVPWLARLDAEGQQAHWEALAAENELQAERLRVIADVRAAWFRLYVLGKQLETAEADRAQLESLAKTANARVATGASQPGDVLMATLELGNLEEQLLGYRQQIVAASAELNRLLGRPAAVPIEAPRKLAVELPEWSHELLLGVALDSQPELNAARLRTAATRWGIEVARLKRRPDVTLGATWMVMDAPGAMSPEAGLDSWTLGVTTTLPLSREKYDSLFDEAARQHDAAHASEEEIALRLDALLRDLWEQARASQQTVALYEKTILPQARQTYEADLKSLVNNTVTFDRVIRDYRALLSLQLGYHRALGQLATTLARIRQAVGVDLADSAAPSPPQH